MRPSISCILSAKGASQVAQVLKNLSANARDINRYGFDSWVGKIPGGGHGNPHQYFCLENPIDRQAWPWDHKELDMTEATSHAHMPSTLLNTVLLFINLTVKMCL